MEGQVKEALKVCPLYGVCTDEQGRKILKPGCISRDPEQYVNCENYDPFIAFGIMDKGNLEVLLNKAKSG